MSNDGAASASMQMQGGIFNDMVMKEAIKDKEIEVNKQITRENDEIMAEHYSYQIEEGKGDKDSDSDFNDDDDDDKFNSMRDIRIAAMKEKFA